MPYLIGMKYISRKELQQIYETSEKANRLTFNTFYGRIQGFGWPIEKALNYPVRVIKKRGRGYESKGA